MAKISTYTNITNIQDDDLYECVIGGASRSVKYTTIDNNLDDGKCLEVISEIAVREFIGEVSAADNQWAAIDWSDDLGLFVAVSINNPFDDQIMLSSDGIVWSIEKESSVAHWRTIKWAKRTSSPRFIALASNNGTNQAQISSNAIDWTLVATPSPSRQWTDFAYSEDQQVGVGVCSDGGSFGVMTTVDGTAWANRVTPSNAWQGVAWSPELGLFVAVADSGTGDRVMISDSGFFWSSQSSAADNDWQSVAWSPTLGLFAAVADSGSGNQVMISSDGVSWATVTTPQDNAWKSIIWAEGLSMFVAVAADGDNRVMTSKDGVTWILRDHAVDNPWNAITWSPELTLLVAVSIGGGTDDRVIRSL